LCGFQWPIGQRRVATPMDEKSYGLEIYESQIQKRHELSAQLRLIVTETIPSWFQRPAGQETRQRPSQSKFISTNSSYKNSKAINRDINDIRYLERSTPTKAQGRFTRYARFTSSDATDGSSNRNYLPQDSTKLSTLRMVRSSSNGFGRSTTTTQNESLMQLRSSDRRSCGSSEREVQ